MPTATHASVSRVPQQARSRASLERILDAAEALIESRPLDSIGVADIAQRAGVSIGNFYKRFASKQEVLGALYARYESQRTNSLKDALRPEQWQGQDLEMRARGLTSLLVEMFRKRRGMIRAFVSHHRNQPGPTRDPMRRRLEDLYRAGADVLLAVKSEIRHPEPNVAARFAVLMTASLCRELILFRPASEPGSIPLTDDELIEELTRVMVGYLRGGELSSIRRRSRARSRS